MFFNFLRRRKPISQENLTLKEKQLLESELAESANSAIPSDIDSDTFGDGSSVNNISRVQATIFQGGIAGIVLRRVFEPRRGWRKEDKEEF